MVEVSYSASIIFFLSFCNLLSLIAQSSLFALTVFCILIAASSPYLLEMPSLASNYLTLWLCLATVEFNMLCTLLFKNWLLSYEEMLMLFFNKFLLIVRGRMYPLYFWGFSAREGWIHSTLSHALSYRFYYLLPPAYFFPFPF